MAAPKNHAKAGGRKKGIPNKITQDLRDKMKTIIEGEIENIQPALNKVRADNPTQYVSLLEKLMGYVIPKKKDITSNDESIVPSVTIIEDRAKPETDGGD